MPANTEAEVLLLCRRRCCVCVGLERDTTMKRGQIAHLDHDPANNDSDNLAFLCFDHHDWYDTQPSQSKRLTLQEVRHFRRELHEVIEQEWRKPTLLPSHLPSTAEVTGHYIREDAHSSAELDVRQLSPNSVRVSGFALWGKDRPLGPNIGEVEFEAPLSDGTVVFRDRCSEQEYRLTLRFGREGLIAEEEYATGYFGLNVTFEGKYARAT